MATRRRRPRAPKLPASILAPTWAVENLVRDLDRSQESSTGPWALITHFNEHLRDQRWGTRIPFPASYQGNASLQVGGAPGLHEPSGSLVLPINAYVVSSAIKGGSANIPVDNAHLYMVWEQLPKTRPFVEPGFLIVSKVVRASDPEPDMAGLLDALKERLGSRR